MYIYYNANPCKAIESLMEAMENATTEHERESIRRMIMQAEED